MAGRVRQSDVEELKSRADLVEVISGYVSLKPASSGSFKGLCPFHSEKSPSFNVRNSPAFYHCFGCGAGGDVFKFLQEIESISFSDAVQRLADKIGFTLTFEEGGADQSSRSRLLAANQAAALYYTQQLQSEEGKFARDFLVSRGFAPDTWAEFGIGYAPKGWQNLLNRLTGQGFSLDELVLSGLVMQSEKGGYDRFRGRVLWPIRDANSQVLGFGARRLFEDDQGPKYLNTPETPVYHKGSVLYGLDSARKSIVKQKQIVVVEGYTDVMACHLAGEKTAVATCGTAFGEDHIKIINRLFGQASNEPASVIFTFDPDAAGEKAALRVYSDTAKFNALTFVAVGPEGLDPADLRQQRGDGAISAMLSSKKPLFEFVIRHRIAKFSLSDLDSRIAAARSAAPVIAELVDPSLRAGYTRSLAEWVSLDVTEVSTIVAQQGRAMRSESVTSMRTSAPVGVAPSAVPQIRLERQILEILVQRPQSFTALQLRRVAAAGFTTAEHQQVLAAAVSIADQLDSVDFANQLANLVSDEQVGLIRELALAPLPVRDDKELERYSLGIVRGALMQALAREKIDLLAALKRIDSAEHSEQVTQIQQQLVELETERRTLM